MFHPNIESFVWRCHVGAYPDVCTHLLTKVNPAQLFLSGANENLTLFLGSADFKQLTYFLCNICDHTILFYMSLIVKQTPFIALQTIFHSVVTPSKSKETIPGEVLKGFKAINILLLLM